MGGIEIKSVYRTIISVLFNFEFRISLLKKTSCGMII